MSDFPVGLHDDPEALAAAMAEDDTFAMYDDEHELSQVDLESDARIVSSVVRDLDRTMTHWEGPFNLERATVAYALIDDARRELKQVRSALAYFIACGGPK